MENINACGNCEYYFNGAVGGMNIFLAIWRLMQGLGITMRNFLRRKVTEKYPENRGEKTYFERFRAQLKMPHDGNGNNKCVACGLCEKACPNGSISVLKREPKVLDAYFYDIGSCMFCGMCVDACPFSAIEFSAEFEHSVFNKKKLIQKLNG